MQNFLYSLNKGICLYSKYVFSIFGGFNDDIDITTVSKISVTLSSPSDITPTCNLESTNYGCQYGTSYLRYFITP